MLEANKSRWFENLFAVYNRFLLNRRFNSLCVNNLEILSAKNSQRPLIIYANHSSWWDGLVAFQISHRAKLDSFVMMEEKQLKNLYPFRKLGAFSVVRESPRQALKSINYAANLLNTDSRRTLWIFPQGEILPNDTRPLEFYRGILRIAEKSDECSIVPLAMRYEFLGNYKPDIFINIGEVEVFSPDLKSRTLAKKLADKLTNNLNSLKSDIIIGNTKDYQDII